MSRPAQCRWCRPLAFLVSGVLHLALAAAVLWPMPGGESTGSGDGDLPLGVTLAMFGAEPGDSPSPFAEREVTEESAPVPLPDATTPDQVEPEPESDAEPTKAPAPEPPPTVESPAPIDRKSTEDSQKPAPPEPKADPEPTPEKETEPKAKPVKTPRTAKEVTSKPKATPRPVPATKATAAAEAPKQRSGEQKAGGGQSRSPDTAGGGGADGARGGSDKAAASRYLAELQKAIAKHRRYPRQAQRRELEGVATVYFVIHADGRITDIRIAKSSGSGLLDEAALETLKRLGTFKPIPREIGRSRWPLRVPIRFALR